MTSLVDKEYKPLVHGVRSHEPPPFVRPTPHGIIIRNHMDHRDKYQAVLTFTVVMGQITSYKLHVEGRHCNGDDCPDLPNEVTIPEPTTMFLFGTGLAAIAIKMRKRLKNRKSG